MRSNRFKALAVAALISVAARSAVARDIDWCGYTWHVRSDANSGPGPNAWSADDVWIDDQKRLHLKIAHTGDKWSCAEIWTDKRLGFGQYQFDVDGYPELMDNNVVLGLFDYPTPEIGPDGTNEIDIEFATWGGQQKEHGNFTVWPADLGKKNGSHTFAIVKSTGHTSDEFSWFNNRVLFSSKPIDTTGYPVAEQNFLYDSAGLPGLIPQHPEPVHINLWLFNGKPPTDDKEVEIVISAFKFTPGNGE